MLRFFSRPLPLVLLLSVCTFIPVLMALVRVVQIPTHSYPDDSARFAIAPVAWFLHALAGTAFGLAGPVNFVLALRRRFGWLHRVTGRVFAVAGSVLGLSGLALLAQVTPQSTAVIDITRAVFSLTLLYALAQTVTAILDRDIQRHRAWAIRAYAIGMGSGTVALVFFPIYLVTGAPPTGPASDILFTASWALNIGFAEWVIRRISPPIRRVST
jgi:uncharacterized membrane protein